MTNTIQSAQKLRSTLRALILIASSLLVASCSKTPEAERWAPAPPTAEGSSSVILVEEYTGQECVHCPRAASVLSQLQERYGKRLVWVSMHASRTGMTRPELASEEANSYAEHFRLRRAIPGIMVNRQGASGQDSYSQTSDLWAAQFAELLQRKPRYDMQLRLQQSGDNYQLKVQVQPLDGTPTLQTLKLQLWLVEDIQAYQLTPSGAKADYLHHHVLRRALNGLWGEAYPTGTSYTHTLSLERDLGGTTTNKKVVAFVYEPSTQEVLTAQMIALGDANTSGANEENEQDIDRPLLQPDRVWYRSLEADYASGATVECTTVEKRTTASGSERIELISPFLYLMPGRVHGAGKYYLRATKLDALEDRTSGFSQFCAANLCMLNDMLDDSMLSEEIELKDSALRPGHSVFVHYELGPEASKKAGRYRVLLELLQGKEVVSTLTLAFVYKP